MDLKELQQLGKEIGFFKIEEMDTGKIKLLPEVRQMCSTDKCHMYGRNWSCPPACGTLEECGEDISGYTRGIIVQTKGELEDEFDGEGMMETEALHKEHFVEMHDRLKKEFPKLLSLGAGCCTRCANAALRRTVPFSGETFFFNGGIRNAGDSGLSGQWDRILLRTWNDYIHQLFFPGIKRLKRHEQVREIFRFYFCERLT